MDFIESILDFSNSAHVAAPFQSNHTKCSLASNLLSRTFLTKAGGTLLNSKFSSSSDGYTFKMDLSNVPPKNLVKKSETCILEILREL